MERALIASDLQKATEFYHDFLKKYGFLKIDTVQNPSDARRMISLNTYDICIVNAPFSRANGIDLAKDIAEKSDAQVILFVREEVAEEVAENVLPFGILTVERPINKQIFRNALQFSAVANERLRFAANAIAKLEKRLKEQGTISRAKCILIANKNISEEEAHKYIEKHAMDERVTRMEIAQEIIEYYEDE